MENMFFEENYESGTDQKWPLPHRFACPPSNQKLSTITFFNKNDPTQTPIPLIPDLSCQAQICSGTSTSIYFLSKDESQRRGIY